MAVSSETEATTFPNVVVSTKTNHTTTTTTTSTMNSSTVPTPNSVSKTPTETETSPNTTTSSLSTTTTTGVGCTNIDVLNSHTNAHKQNLLFKLGGKETLKKIIDRFYTHLSSNECEIHMFFHKTNIQMLKWHQYTFLSIAFTNPDIICADNFDIQTTILKRHEHMFTNDGLNEHHYDIMMKYLVRTLTEMKIDPVYIEEALHVLLPLRAVFQKGAILAHQRRLERMERDTIIQMTAAIVVTTIAVAVVAFGIFHHRSKTLGR